MSYRKRWVLQDNTPDYKVKFIKSWVDQQDIEMSSEVCFRFFDYDQELMVDISIENYQIKGDERTLVNDAVIDLRDFQWMTIESENIFKARQVMTPDA